MANYRNRIIIVLAEPNRYEFVDIKLAELQGCSRKIESHLRATYNNTVSLMVASIRHAKIKIMISLNTRLAHSSNRFVASALSSISLISACLSVLATIIAIVRLGLLAVTSRSFSAINFLYQ